jgi:glycosyltransferase involved in cell wall biosynthesis
MKRILIVAYYYPPLATSGAMRPLAFTRWLREHDWAPSVLTIDPACVEPGIDVDPALELRVPPTTRVLRVPYKSPRTKLLEFRAAVNTITAPLRRQLPAESASKPSTRSDTRVTLREAIVERLFGFPDSCASWIRPAVRSAVRAFRSEPPDVVLATAPPWSTLLVGQGVAQAFGVPLVLDFRDPWTRNPVRRTRTAWAERKAQQVEDALIRSSALVIANTEESREQLASGYPDSAAKMRTITNGFDPELFQQAATATGIARPLELCHFGSLYGQRRPLHLLRALNELSVRYGPALRERLRLRLIGSWEIEHQETNTLAESLERAGVISREPSIPHAECLNAMRRAAVLLVLQPSSPVQIPGKLYEYVASGRPILLVGGDGATEALVERHRLGWRTRDEQGEIVSTLTALIERPEALPTPSTDQILRFDYGRLTARLAAELNAVCGRADDISQPDESTLVGFTMQNSGGE